MTRRHRVMALLVILWWRWPRRQRNHPSLRQELVLEPHTRPAVQGSRLARPLAKAGRVPAHQQLGKPSPVHVPWKWARKAAAAAAEGWTCLTEALRSSGAAGAGPPRLGGRRLGDKAIRLAIVRTAVSGWPGSAARVALALRLVTLLRGCCKSRRPEHRPARRARHSQRAQAIRTRRGAMARLRAACKPVRLGGVVGGAGLGGARLAWAPPLALYQPARDRMSGGQNGPAWWCSGAARLSA